MGLRSQRRWLILLCVLVISLCACAPGARIHDEGLDALTSGDRDIAIVKLREAVAKEPTNARYKLELLQAQSTYAAELVQRADALRRAGQTEEAAALYEKAAAVQPGNDRATRGAADIERDARHARLLAEAEQASKEGLLDNARIKIRLILAENPSNSAARKLSGVIADLQGLLDQDRAATPAAQAILRKPVTLQFRDASIRMVFEALSRTTGLNIVLDRDVRSDMKTTIFVKDASVGDTVDLILLQNQLEKRTLNANTLFVYPATAAKQKEYQDLQVRTFRLGSVDVKYMQNLLKTVLKIKEVLVDERTSTLVVRDTPDAVAVAAKLIAAQDVPEPEVMLEVEILEISRNRLANIGLQLPTTFSVATPSTVATLGALRSLRSGDLTTSSLSATLNLQLQDTDANLLASPRIRTRNKEKAKILIGDRIPTITNTVTPVSTGTPVITGSVQYQEVGLKLEFEPEVYNDQEVGIKISLEVSNIAQQFTDAQGGRSYQIGTRNAQTSLRLRDGETQILGGLISDQERNTADKVPGLGHLPLVGSVFGNNNGTRNKTELVMAITPRIIRAPAIAEIGVRDIFSGTESSLRERPLRLDTVGEVRVGAERFAAANPGAGGLPGNAVPAAQAGNGIQQQPRIGLPVGQGDRSPQLVPPPVARDVRASNTGATDATKSEANIASGSISSPSDPALTSIPANGDLQWTGPPSVNAGQELQLTLMASSLTPSASLPLTVRFDPAALRFVDAELGSVSLQAGSLKPQGKIDAIQGLVELPLSFAQPGALRGTGALITLRFVVSGQPGETAIVLQPVAVLGSDGVMRSIPAGLRSVTVRIDP